MINGLLALGMLISVPCFVLGLINPKIFRLKSRKQSSWVWFLIFLSSCTGLAISPSSPPPVARTKQELSPSIKPSTSPNPKLSASSSPKLSASPSPKPSASPSSKPSASPSIKPSENPYLKDFQSFKSSISSIDTKAHNKLSKITEAIKKAENGDDSISLVDVIILANSAQDDLRASETELYGLEIPKSFPKDSRNKCEKVLELLRMGYQMKDEAMTSFVSAIDNQKPSEAAKTKQKINEANQYIFGATSLLLQVQLELGIPLN